MTEHIGNAVGKQLGNYRLQRLLGTGGFADVYLGEHLHLGTLAAIKILHTKLAGDEVDLFRQEARLIARLSHPHIIRVFDFDVEDMTPFLIMDYAPGGTLRQRHPKRTQVPLATVVEYVKQIAAGLQYAHDQRLVHRDIKPENMLIDQRGTIVISDFGVASAVHSTKSQTVVELAGTLPYIAPEQLQGLPRPASDQYALAVVVYEWISGERPFQGTFAEIVSQHMAKIPSPLYGHFPEVSPGVESVIFKALSKDPRDRFATIQEFATTLELAYRGETTLKPLSSHSASLNYSTRQEMPYGQKMYLTAEPDTLHSTHTTRENGQGSYSNTPPSYPSTLNLPSNPIISSPVQAIHPAQHIPITRQNYRKPHWKLIAIITPLFLALLSGGVFLSYQDSVQMTARKSISLTATANSQATAAAQQAMAATQTATTQASTPQGLYSLVTSRPPTFSDSLAAQSTQNWDTNSACAFSGGHYVISASTGSFAQCFATSTNLCNLGYQVQMTTLSGDGGGLIFRQASNGYRWRVSPDGSYDLVNASSTMTSGNSGVIQQGISATNQLTIIAQGTKLFLYINSQYITSITDKVSGCGSIGLMAVGFGSNAKAAFSNAKVWSL